MVGCLPRGSLPAIALESGRPGAFAHGILIFLVVIVVEYLVVPELVGASKNIHYLERLNIGWLAAGVGFEAASLFAYALLTWTVLPHHRPSISRIFRIDLSTTAVAHTMPGGTAAWPASATACSPRTASPAPAPGSRWRPRASARRSCST